jgi:hypothetical protein|tara:strand:- start:800 stop:1408 length:609 start_codon:yes stop_codon:yes gene_type:complete
MVKKSRKRAQTKRIDNNEYAAIGALALVVAAIFVLQVYDFGFLGDATGTFDVTVSSGVGCTIDQNATIGSTAAGSTVTTADYAGETGTGLVLNNTGNVDLRVDIVSNASNTTLFPGTQPLFLFNVSLAVGGDVETGGDILTNNGTDYGSWTNVSTSSIFIVDNFTYLSTNDTIRIDFNVSIPVDATPGTKKATITLNCTQNP